MEQGYSLSNIFKNTTKKQRIAFIIVLVVIIALISVLFMLVGASEETAEETTDSEEEVALFEGVAGDTIENEEEGDGTKIDVPVSTDYNSKHSYTLIDYLPKGEYKFLTGEESFVNSITYYIIKENTAVDKGIVVSVDVCDVKGNKKAANDYLKSLPIDLSEYVIVYQTHGSDVPCDMH